MTGSGRNGGVRGGLALLTVFLGLPALVCVGQAEASPSDGLRVLPAAKDVTVAPGVELSEHSLTASHGATYGYLLTADLTNPHVSADLLYPGTVSDRKRVSVMADHEGAVAGVNGDFFDFSGTEHTEYEPTGAPAGPAVMDGQWLKAAGPAGQSLGPPAPAGTPDGSVFGVRQDGTAGVGALTLKGQVSSEHGTVPLRGFNQYAIPVNGVGVFTTAWGTRQRGRAICGTDDDRKAPCSSDVYEVTVKQGRVVKTSDTPGSGAIPPNTDVLLGRESGADALRKLKVGDEVKVDRQLVTSGSSSPFTFAVGGFPIATNGKPVDGLDDSGSAVRAAAGASADGHKLYLFALSGDPKYWTGLTMAELAKTMIDLGADTVFDLDGGGSTTLVTRDQGASDVTVRNHPTDGSERAVTNGIGIFSDS